MMLSEETKQKITEEYNEWKDRIVKVIMNPPYNGSLHLKILNNVINVLPNSEVASLSPVDFISNLGKYHGWNKEGLVDNCLANTESLDIFDHETSNGWFCLGNQIGELGIWHVEANKTKGLKITDYNDEFKIKMSKLSYFAKPSLWSKYIRKEEDAPYKVQVYKWHETFDRPEECILAPDNGNNSYVVPFDTEVEAENFKQSISLKLMKYFISTLKNCNPAHLPYLGDYTHKWSDEDLYKYFNLTDEEVNIIENEITN